MFKKERITPIQSFAAGIGTVCAVGASIFFYLYLRTTEVPVYREIVIPSAKDIFVPYSERAWVFYPDSEQRYAVRFPEGVFIHPFVADKNDERDGKRKTLRQVGGVGFSAAIDGPGPLAVKVYDDPVVKTLQDWVDFQNSHRSERVVVEEVITIDGNEAWVTYSVSGEGEYEEHFVNEKKTIFARDGKLFELWTRFYDDPAAHKLAWKYFRFLKVGEHDPGYDAQQAEFFRLLEEKNKLPVVHCEERSRACDVAPEDLNVIVHVPEGLSVQEAFQSPMDSGLLRTFRVYGRYFTQDDITMYATSADYAVDVGEGISPYAAPALDMTQPLNELIRTIPRPDIQRPEIVEMDGKKGLLFYWIGDTYGCNRQLDAMLIVPNPAHAYSNFVFGKTLERTSCEQPAFAVDDARRLIAEHDDEVRRWLDDVDRVFDIK